MPFSTDTKQYHELSPLKLWRHGGVREKTMVAVVWLALLAACVTLGVMTVALRWSGLPLSFGGVTVYITVYPPLLVCLLLTMMLGWWWGAVPAYVSTLVLALYADMPVQWALLFACANPLGFAVMTIGYRALAMRRDLRSPTALLYYIQLCFVSSIFSSAGALIWTYTNRLAPGAQLPIWQGWWLGAFLESVLLGGPLLAMLWPAWERWQQNHEHLMRGRRGSRRAVLRMMATVALGVLLYGFVTIRMAEADAARAPDVFRQTVWIVYFVFSTILVFSAFFGYQLFSHWQDSTDDLLSELQRMNTDLARLATTDSLTGLLNRRAGDRQLDAEWQRARRSGRPAALILLDIDHFKLVNDRHGHPGGDAALRMLAHCIRDTMREVDMAARYGGEEFIVLLPDTPRDGVLAFAERLRACVAATEVVHDGRAFHCSISLGVALSDPFEPSYEHWVRRADQALYRAKHDGRNCVAMAG